MIGEAEAALLDRSRVAHLATAARDGTPHVVPLCYARDGDAIYFIVDEKPKQAGKRLKRLRNIAENPAVALVVDVYDEDWDRLEYLLVQGRATTVADAAEFAHVLGLLRARYPQYHRMRLDLGHNELVRITPVKVHHWRSNPTS